jgi:D-glycero-D-manno-heptose 1,7-bisphosphate phosphatase
MSRAAVFLDRDGTMIEDVGYLNRVEDIRVFPWTTDAIRSLNRAGFLVIVVTNQSAIARGMLTEEGLAGIHARLDETIAAAGGKVAAYYHCPHHPEGVVAAFARSCDCRKPAAGMIERAAADLDIDVTRSFVVGDKWIDIGLARAVGARAVLVRTGYGAAEARRAAAGLSADAILDDLGLAANWIILNS